MSTSLKASVITVLFIYVVYGIFFPQLPLVNADELWETSRGYFLKKMHYPGEPLLPMEVAPFYAALGKLGWKSWLLVTGKSASFAAMMSVLPVSELFAMRLAMFCWSVAACIFTYFLSRRLGLDKWYSLLVVALLAILPEFFSQIHRERSEIIITSCFTGVMLIFLKGYYSESISTKRMWYLIAGLLAWWPTWFVHPSAIVIPAVTGILYLILERKNLISITTLLIGAGLISGCVFFLFLMNSLKEFAIAAGGGNYFLYQGPPVIVKGWKYVITIPYAFYNKFFVANIFTRPVSFLFYVTGFICLLPVYFRKNIFLPASYIVIITSSIVSLSILYLFSGSFGSYNVIIAPFLITGMVIFLKNKFHSVKKVTIISITSLLILLVTSFAGIADDIRHAKEYNSIISKVRQNTGTDGAVLGLALYYNVFKDQSYYSNSWFNQYGGIPGQSFQEAVSALKVKYIIADDAFVGRAVLDRGKDWTDSMLLFLEKNCTQVAEIHADYFVGNRVPVPDKFPAVWKQRGVKAKFITNIVIYKVN
jgi:hypothetical protein